MSRSSSSNRFLRSMTPSASVKMTPTKFNLVCGRPRDLATAPDLSKIPNPQPPRVIDARVTTPTMSRREFSTSCRRRESSLSRDARVVAPTPPARNFSLNLPFGSYAEIGCHTRPPAKYSTTSYYNSSANTSRSRRSQTPSLAPTCRPQSSYVGSSSVSSSYGGSSQRRFSATFTQQSFQSVTRQRHNSCSVGTPASARGISFY